LTLPVRAEGTINADDHPWEFRQPFNHDLKEKRNLEQSENESVGLGFKRLGWQSPLRRAHGWAGVGNSGTKDDENRLT
jgi:hypothetical protein